ncbi:hypothetical protein AB0J74_27370 [Asanoa sp. NPDC049573]|uniref:hypothetical protein n=1 Tax=Asanoa sp. NPDC049573 TaxID=3155396 RepID=UPI0034312B12
MLDDDDHPGNNDRDDTPSKTNENGGSSTKSNDNGEAGKAIGTFSTTGVSTAHWGPTVAS